MSDSYKILQLRRGSSHNAPLLHQGELAYLQNTNELLIGGLECNITPSFDGGNILDKKGTFRVRHGNKVDFNTILPNEIIYFEDEKQLIIGLENNKYLVLNDILRAEFNERIDAIEDKEVLFDPSLIPAGSIAFSQLGDDVKEAISASIPTQIQLLLGDRTVRKEMLADYSVLERTIEPYCISTTKIKDQAITKKKLAPDVIEEIEALNHFQIPEGSITFSQLSGDVLEAINAAVPAQIELILSDRSITKSKLAPEVTQEINLLKREIETLKLNNTILRQELENLKLNSVTFKEEGEENV